MELNQLIEECKKHGIDITPLIPKTTFKFTATALIETGLGPEYITFIVNEAKNIAEAQQMAENEASIYFKTNYDAKKAVLKEVRIKPV